MPDLGNRLADDEIVTVGSWEAGSNLVLVMIHNWLSFIGYTVVTTATKARSDPSLAKGQR